METIVDQLKTVNSKSFLNEIKNPSNITILILKNFNNETNWDEISKFPQLKEIQLENCLIDNNIFHHKSHHNTHPFHLHNPLINILTSH